jgi:hypothetical protein
VEYGTCPRDKPFPNEQADVRTLSYAKLHAFDFQTHGQFFWNFRTEFETRWDYLRVRTGAHFLSRDVLRLLLLLLKCLLFLLRVFKSSCLPRRLSSAGYPRTGTAPPPSMR